MGDAQGQDHLVFPQGDGVDDGGLDLLGHHRVIALDQADLRAHLDGDVAGQLQVVQLLLKAVTQVGQVAGSLSILGQLGALGFFLRSLQVGIAHLLQLLFAGQDVHRQFFKVDKVQLIHLVQHGDVLHQGDLVVLQLGLDALHVLVSTFVAGLELFQVIACLFEQTQKALGLLGGGVKALQLRDQAGDEFAGLAHILGLDAGEGGLGEVAQLLLAGGAVLQHHLGVGDIDLLGKVIDHLLLFGAKRGILDLDRLGLGGFQLGSLGGFVRDRVQCQGGGSGGGQVQFIVQFSHGRSSFPFQNI